MEVRVTPEARDYVATHGGAVYVRARSTRCCSGSMVSLVATTTTPRDAGRFVAADDPYGVVRYLGDGLGGPAELTIELRGSRRPRLAAYWDGCAYRL